MAQPLSPGLQKAQHTSTVWLAWGSIIAIPGSLLLGWLIGEGALLPTVLVEMALFLMALVALREPSQTARLAASVALVGQAMLITGAMASQPWQIDSHMLFFAVLATLASLVDISVLVLGAGIIVAHHLALTLAMPALIYPSVDLLPNVGRTLLHGAIVAMELAALIVTVQARLRLDREALILIAEMAGARAESDQARLSAEAATQEATRALVAAKQATQALELSRKAESAMAEQDLQNRERAQQLALERAARQAHDTSEQKMVVEALRAALSALAAGDLTCLITQGLPERYEDLRRDFNQMLVSLSQTMQIALLRTGSIDGETISISAAAVRLAERAEHQASTMEATAAALEQITVSVQTAAVRANAARVKSQAVSASAESGRSVVDSAMQTMKQIETSSVKISRITAVIDDISFQTNLLALNAGVEAARVGEAGRGFAVVASEVRALAQRSADAAREINGLIGASGALVKQGVERVHQTGQVLLEILDQVNHIAEDVGEIANSTTEQSKGITELNRSMQSLGQLTQQIAAMFEETTAATAALENDTGQLRTVLSQFQTVPSGSADWPTGRAA